MGGDLAEGTEAAADDRASKGRRRQPAFHPPTASLPLGKAKQRFAPAVPVNPARLARRHGKSRT